MFAAPIYFASFRGHLYKINREQATAGLWGCWLAWWAKSGPGRQLGGCTRCCPPLKMGREKATVKKEERKRQTPPPRPQELSLPGPPLLT